MDVFFDIHKGLPREGSGRDEYTQRAFEMIPALERPRILDIGCGPGLQTIHLARLTDGPITALDIHQPYLDNLTTLAEREHFSQRITTVNQSMDAIKFPDESFDIIWAEGSIFIIGFERGLREWKRFLRPQGYLAVHEMAWLKDNPPQEIKAYWEKVYPEIKTIEKDLKIIERSGYRLLGHFALPDDAWWEFYYTPLEKRVKQLRTKYAENPEALEMLRLEQEEIDLFRKYHSWYGSVFYVMQKP
ncbi:MAG: class I SAM-dependent methyltransferase [Candidatus Thermoplasmatota archaeon]|nr:class I SAM-dependent methyltransferase [Candidatus Thermoplasmatota archaeon]